MKRNKILFIGLSIALLFTLLPQKVLALNDNTGTEETQDFVSDSNPTNNLRNSNAENILLLSSSGSILNAESLNSQKSNPTLVLSDEVTSQEIVSLIKSNSTFTYSCSAGVVSYSTELLLNNVALLRYSAPTVKTVTFTTETSFDSYLYVIDPRSADPISSNGNAHSTYNDDGAGNFDAEITKKLDANIPYLIIISAYNPSAQSGIFKLNFSY